MLTLRFQKQTLGLPRYRLPQRFHLNLKSTRGWFCCLVQGEIQQAKCLPGHKLTFHFGVVHGFVFGTFDSQLHTVPRQQHPPRLWMLRAAGGGEMALM